MAEQWTEQTGEESRDSTPQPTDEANPLSVNAAALGGTDLPGDPTPETVTTEASSEMLTWNAAELATADEDSDTTNAAGDEAATADGGGTTSNTFADETETADEAGSASSEADGGGDAANEATATGLAGRLAGAAQQLAGGVFEAVRERVDNLLHRTDGDDAEGREAQTSAAPQTATGGDDATAEAAPTPRTAGARIHGGREASAPVATTTEDGPAATSDEGEGDGEGRRRRRKRGGSGRKGRKLDTFTPGEELQGTVRSVQPYGAFVDVGAERDGLVHISELRDGYVEKVEDVVKDGDAVTVRVKEVDVDKGRLSLTMRTRERSERPSREPRSDTTTSGEGGEGGAGGEAPQRERRERRPAGEGEGASNRIRLRDLQERQALTGRVTSIVEFGAFIDVGAATDGLVHISELSEGRVNRVSDVLQEGQEVQVWVLGVDRKRNRISLSLKEPQGGGSDALQYQTEEPQEAVPSAMEDAFARARGDRDRRDDRKGTGGGDERREGRREGRRGSKRGRDDDDEMDDIIARTLRQRLD